MDEKELLFTGEIHLKFSMYIPIECLYDQSVRPVAETGRAHGWLEHINHRHRHSVQAERANFNLKIFKRFYNVVGAVLFISLKFKLFTLRKISRGRIWLDYKHWKDFLLELSAAKKLGLTDLISKLEMCGKPAISLTRRK